MTLPVKTWTMRLAVMDDVAALRELIRLSALGLNIEHYTAEQVASNLKYVYGVDTQLILDQTYFVVQAGDQYIGCGGWSKRKTLFGGDQHKEAVDNLLDPATDAARIRAFFVHPDWARQGIGSALMQACEQAARDAGFHLMELMATLTGEFLYRRFGFEVVEEVNQALPDGVVMQLRRMRKTLNA